MRGRTKGRFQLGASNKILLFYVLLGVLYFRLLVEMGFVINRWHIVMIMVPLPLIFYGFGWSNGIFRGRVLILSCFYIFGVVLCSGFYPVLSGPDEYRFYQNATSYSFFELVEYSLNTAVGLGETIEEKTVTFISSRFTFPAIVSILMPAGQEVVPPDYIHWVNVLLWLVAVRMLVNAVPDFYSQALRNDNFRLGVLIFLLASPTSIYWSSVFSKDIAGASMVVFCVVNLLARRYFLSVTFGCVALLISSMAIPMIPLLYALLSKSQKNLRRLLIVALSVVLIVSALDFVAIANVLMMSLYTLLSPNPLVPQNWAFVSEIGQRDWLAHPVGFMTFESVVVFSTVFLGFSMAMRSAQSRFVLQLFVTALVVVGCIWVVRGVVTLDDYGLGSTGGNFVRYKLGAWAVVALCFGFAVSEVMHGIRTSIRRPSGMASTALSGPGNEQRGSADMYDSLGKAHFARIKGRAGEATSL